ncbi:PAS domain S-box protein [Paracrocinitomix mangrovi]|uniref:PAS domain S-box protein n=1 Tax=Paracrocinitomix mangrovi TaxID=2862509 RepID=UPI001C8E8A73|nr:PAS domain S-box protein [Paracrocinitomix mangrovi]UKN00564.1 PAS domain S-box protein [Paracrocinitomix mangrovi]
MINKFYNSTKEIAIDNVYKTMAYILVPIVAGFLLLGQLEYIELGSMYQSILIYLMFMLIILAVLGKFQLFKSNFKYAHYTFLAGVMILNLVWYYLSGTSEEKLSLLLCYSLIGISLIDPKVTLWFYILSIAAFLGVSLAKNNIDLQLGFLIVSTAVVISVFNVWRHQINLQLKASRHSYKSIFDSSQQQIYVVNKDHKILELSITAEENLKANGLTNFTNLSFGDVYKVENEPGKKTLNSGFKEALETGASVFQISCACSKTADFIPLEMSIRLSKYFNEEVFVVTVRTLKDQFDFQKELIEHKDNVTQILNNIDYFVFNVTYDVSERFKHHVNFVSSRVKEVYGCTIDEYIALIKAERLSKDFHPEDVDRVNKQIEALFITGGKAERKYRKNVKGEWRWMEEKLFVEKLEEGNRVSIFGMTRDVTDEMLAEQKLIESEKRYRQIFENNLAGVYKTHVNGQILDCNPAFAKILGYDSVEELKDKKIQDLYQSKQDRLDYIASLKEKKELNNYTSHLIRKDGRSLILNNNVSILPDENGDENIIVGTVIDVTDLHETSLALRHSEEKYRLLFEESNNAILLIVIADKENYIVDANQMGSDLFGMLEDEIIGKQLNEFLFEGFAVDEELADVIKELKKVKKEEREWEFKKPDGASFYAEISFTYVQIDDEQVLQMVIKDISDRKQYEKEILQSRLSFKNIVDRSPSSILIFSKNELVYVNPKGEDLYYKMLNSKSRNLFDIFPKEKHVLIRDLIAEAENDINSYTEIDLGTGDELKRFSINVVSTIYNFEKAVLFLLQDITLQTEYNIQKLRAEMAEEANIQLQEEVNRHKRTQLSLLESTSRLKALFESAANLFIISLDKDLNLVSYNQNFKNMVKNYLDIDVEIGQNFMKIFPIEDYAYEIISDRLSSVLNGTPSNLVSKFKAKQGYVWMESFMSPIQIGNEEVKEISFISHDITEQIHNRRKILESEENNRAILLAMPDLLFKVTKEGVFTDYRATSEENKAAFKQLTRSTDIVGKKVADVFKDKQIADEIEKNLKETIENDLPVTHNFSISLDKGSEKVYFENRYSKINDEEAIIISRNVTADIENELKLIESIKEKEVLLKEVHHRVKNNLQVINSILNLQSSYIEDEETLQIIIESQNRIRSMSFIHESLYQTKDFSSINFKDYITNLVQNLVHTYEVYSDKTDLDLKIEDVDLALDQAIPCGLILNELITNALKYAYPEGQSGKITIEVFEKDGKVYMRVQDFGVGLPEEFDISETDTLGLSLVDTLIDQLDGELLLKTQKGTEILIIFEKQAI